MSEIYPALPQKKKVSKLLVFGLVGVVIVLCMLAYNAFVWFFVPENNAFPEKQDFWSEQLKAEGIKFVDVESWDDEEPGVWANVNIDSGSATLDDFEKISHVFLDNVSRVEGEPGYADFVSVTTTYCEDEESCDFTGFHVEDLSEESIEDSITALKFSTLDDVRKVAFTAKSYGSGEGSFHAADVEFSFYEFDSTYWGWVVQEARVQLPGYDLLSNNVYWEGKGVTDEVDADEDTRIERFDAVASVKSVVDGAGCHIRSRAGAQPSVTVLCDAELFESRFSGDFLAGVKVQHPYVTFDTEVFEKDESEL